MSDSLDWADELATGEITGESPSPHGSRTPQEGPIGLDPGFDWADELVVDRPKDFGDAMSEIGGDGFWTGVGRVLPYAGAAMEASDMAKLYGAARRVEAGEATEEDEQALYSFIHDSQREATWGYTFGSIVAALPGFALEFATSGPAASGGKAAAKAAFSKALGDAIEKTAVRRGVDLASSAAGLAAQTVAMEGLSTAAGALGGELTGGRSVASAYQRALPEMGITEADGERIATVFGQTSRNLTETLPAGFVDTWIELVSEKSGGAIAKLPGVQRLQALQTQIMQKWLKANPDRGVSDFLDLVSERTGWHGALSEVGEERVGEALRAILLGDEWELPSMQQFTAELAAFSVPGAAGAGIRAVTGTQRATQQGDGAQAPHGGAEAPSTAQPDATPADATPPATDAAPTASTGDPGPSTDGPTVSTVEPDVPRGTNVESPSSEQREPVDLTDPFAQPEDLTGSQGPLPEGAVSIGAQMDALLDGRVPAVLVTPGSTPPTLIPEGFVAIELGEGDVEDPGSQGTLIAPIEDAEDLVEAFREGRVAEALGYGVEGMPEEPTRAVIARDAQGRIVRIVGADEATEQAAIDAAVQAAGDGGNVESVPAAELTEALLERAGETVSPEQGLDILERRDDVAADAAEGADEGVDVEEEAPPVETPPEGETPTEGVENADDEEAPDTDGQADADLTPEISEESGGAEDETSSPPKLVDLRLPVQEAWDAWVSPDTHDDDRKGWERKLRRAIEAYRDSHPDPEKSPWMRSWRARLENVGADPANFGFEAAPELAPEAAPAAEVEPESAAPLTPEIREFLGSDWTTRPLADLRRVGEELLGVEDLGNTKRYKGRGRVVDAIRERATELERDQAEADRQSQFDEIKARVQAGEALTDDLVDEVTGREPTVEVEEDTNVPPAPEAPAPVLPSDLEGTAVVDEQGYPIRVFHGTSRRYKTKSPRASKERELRQAEDRLERAARSHSDLLKEPPYETRQREEELKERRGELKRQLRAEEARFLRTGSDDQKARDLSWEIARLENELGLLEGKADLDQQALERGITRLEERRAEVQRIRQELDAMEVETLAQGQADINPDAYGENDEGHLAAGAYFTDAPGEAGDYAGGGNVPGGRIIPAYLNLRNPYRPGKDAAVDRRYEELSQEIYEREARKIRNARGDVDQYARARALSRRWALEDMGFDGMIAPSTDRSGSTEYVAFRKAQILSGIRGDVPQPEGLASETVQQAPPEPTLGPEESSDAATGQEDLRERPSGTRPDVVPGDAEGGDAGGVRAGSRPGGERAGDATDLRPDSDPGGDDAAGVSEPGESVQPGGEPGPGGRAESDGGGDPAGDAPAAADFEFATGELDALEKRSWKEKGEDNLAAILLLRDLRAAGRRATVEEQRVLARYVGWGAQSLQKALPGEKVTGGTKWQKDLRERLSELLTKEELDRANRSRLNAHYTAESVIEQMYGLLERAGFAGGRVLEPGMGVGHFRSLMPRAWTNTSYTGIELDVLTAEIAGHLHPTSDIRQEGFQDTKIPDDYFDLAIGNPPFAEGAIKGDPRYAKLKLPIHDFMFAKTIDAVRPGGLVAFVTSRFTMDKATQTMREYVSERADLVGAVRLPGTAFRKNADTQVVTDIIVLRKKGGGPIPNTEFRGQGWLGLQEITAREVGEVGSYDPPRVNEYFAEHHPEHVVGEFVIGRGMHHKGEVMVEETGDLAEGLAAAFETFPRGIYTEADQSIQETPAELVQPTAEGEMPEEGAYVVRDGDLFQVEGGALRPRPVTSKADGIKGIPRTHDKKIRQFVRIRDARSRVLAEQLAGRDSSDAQQELNDAYDEFVAEHGPLNKVTTTERPHPTKPGETIVTRRYPNAQPFQDDPLAWATVAVEKYDEATGEAQKTDIFTKNVARPEAIPQISSPFDALNVSLAETGKVDLERAAELAEMDQADLVEALGDEIFQNPETGAWEPADEYLTGLVGPKLRYARAAASESSAYRRNVAALEAVQPEPLGPSEIEPWLGSDWIPSDVVEQFAQERLGLETVRVSWRAGVESNYWIVNGGEAGVAAQSTWGIPQFPAGKVLASLLDQKAILVRVKTEQGSYVDEEATTAANEKRAEMREAWSEWVWADAERTSALLDTYNARFNKEVPFRANGEHLELPGSNPLISLRPHQKDAIWRIVRKGNTYMAHSVGAGKTMAMVGAHMEMRRLGMVKKPMLVVPNHMLGQFAREFIELYPTARILTADSESLTPKKRARFLGRIANSEWDSVIITQQAFERIPISARFEAAETQKIIDDYKDVLEELEQDQRDAGARQWTQRQLERRLAKMEERLEEIRDRPKDKGLTFEQLGVDFITVDEAHAYRKLDVFTTMQEKGIDPSGAKRSMDLFLKSRYLERMKPGRNLVLASGTPVTNTMGEVYTIQRFLDEDSLRRDGLMSFRSWATMFGELASDYEMTPDGKWIETQRFMQFHNLPALMRPLLSRMDVVKVGELVEKGLMSRPAMKGGGVQVIAGEKSDLLIEYQRELQRRLDYIKNLRPEERRGANHYFSVRTDARLAALDTRFIPGHQNDAPDPESKIERLIENAYEIYRRGKKAKLTQIVFGDLGTSADVKAKRGFGAFEAIRDGLVARGVKPDEIAFMRDFKKPKQKADLFDAMNEGRVRFLLGSTQNMGTGVNVQKRLVALHNLDAPQVPADVEQRIGRILRQGNWNDRGEVRDAPDWKKRERAGFQPEIEVYGYVTKRSFDATMWGLLERKQKMIDAVMSGDLSIHRMGDVSAESDSAASAKAIASDNPLVFERLGLESEVRRLENLARAHDAQQAQLRKLIGREGEIAPMRAEADGLEAAAPEAVDVSGDLFQATLAGETYTSRKEAGDFLVEQGVQAILRDRRGDREGPRELGTFAGYRLEVEASARMMKDEALFTMTGTNGAYRTLRVEVEEISPMGVVARLTNLSTSFEDAAKELRQQAAGLERQIQDAKGVVGGGFRKAGELEEKRERLAEVELELAAEAKAEAAPQVPEAEPGEQDDPGEAGMPALPAGVRKPGGQPDDGFTDPEAVTPVGGHVWRKIQQGGAVPPGDTISAPQVIRALAGVAQAVGVSAPIRIGRLTRAGYAGVFKVLPEVIRIRIANDISTAAHEVGHALQKGAFGWRNPIGRGETGVVRELEKLGKRLYGPKRPSAGYRREGFAELVRMMLTGVDTERMAPNATRWLRGYFEANPKVGMAVAKARKAARTWDEQGAVERGKQTIVDPASAEQRLRRTKTGLRRAFSKAAWVESAAAIQDLEAVAEEKLGRPLTESERPYNRLSARRSTSDAIVARMVDTGMLNILGQRIGRSLKDAVALVRDQRELFTVYLYARRALALYNERLEDQALGKFTARNPGIAWEDAHSIVEELGNERFELAASQVYEWQEGVLDYAAEASPVFAEIVERIREVDPGNYIPLQREMEQIDSVVMKMRGGGGVTATGIAKRLRGSGRRVKDPFQSMIANAKRTVQAAHERAVLDAVVKLSKVEGMGNIIEKVPHTQAPVAARTLQDLIDDINQRVSDAYGGMVGGDAVRVEDEFQEFDFAGEMMTFFKPVERPGGKDPVLPVWNGNSIDWYQVDGELYDALLGQDVYVLNNFWAKWLLGVPTKLFRAGTTGLRASFGLVTNPLRDVQILALNTQTQAGFFEILGAWTRSMAEYAVAAFTGKESPWVAFWRDLGGEMAQTLGQDIAQTRRAARRVFRSGSKRVRVLERAEDIWDWIRDVLQFPEGAARITELRLIAREMGWEPGDPITEEQVLRFQLAGKQVTTDFTAAGHTARVLNQVSPFFNAQIQSVRAHTRAAERDPRKFAFRGMQIAAYTLALWWMLKDEEWYQEISIRERLGYWHVPVPGTDEVLRIPRAFEAGMVFAAFPEALAEAAWRNDRRQLEEWLPQLLQPIDRLPMPVLANVVLEQSANRVFFWDRPIVPMSERMGGTDRVPPEEQVGPYTTRAAQTIGELFGVSPRRVDHAIKGVFGGLGIDLLNVIGAGPKEQERDFEASDTWIIGRLFKRGGQLGTRPQSITELYELYDDAVRRQNSRAGEDEVERELRLMLNDARRAVSALSFVRTYAEDSEQAKGALREALTIAQDVAKKYREEFIDRETFRADRKYAEALKESITVELEIP